MLQRRNNFIREFEKFDDISSWLRDQWAGLFTEFLNQKSRETSLKDLASQVSELGNVSYMLKEYTESIMKKVQPDESRNIIQREEKRLREMKIRRFAREPMIVYLTEKEKLSPTKMYNGMVKALTLDEFLELSGMKQGKIPEFIKMHREEATKDFSELKIRYVIQLPDLQQDEDSTAR